MIAVVLAWIVRAGAIAVAAQVGRHHHKALGQPISDLVPGDVRQWVPMQQQERRPLASLTVANPRSAGLEVVYGESLEHVACSLPDRDLPRSSQQTPRPR